MRLLCIETSSRRGSVVLAEGPRVVARATHSDLNAHAERLRPLLDQVLGQAGWTKADLDRVGVGMGPGSFTGLRVGIAFAQGIALGLGIELIGVGSLEAMAAACPAEVSAPRVALIDARRDEVFAQAFDQAGRALCRAEALPRPTALCLLAERFPGAVFLGEVAQELADGTGRFLKTKAWADTERIVVGGGFRQSRVGELAIARTDVILKSEDFKVDLVPIRFHPDEAGLIGCLHLAPSWLFEAHDSIPAVDIGGTNSRCGVVETRWKKAKDLSKAGVFKSELWRHADDEPTREGAVKRLVKMLKGLITEAEAEELSSLHTRNFM